MKCQVLSDVTRVAPAHQVFYNSHNVTFAVQWQTYFYQYFVMILK